MTNRKDVVNDPNYLPVLDNGFIGIAYEELNDETLIPAVLGNDKSITRSARMSYGKGTKAVSDDRNLLRYLLRHRHTTPFEMAEVKFHAKLPIFVARQWVRHRTASINEYSARYSVMTDEFYVPEPKHMLPQSTNNKQGRSGDMSGIHKQQIAEVMDQTFNESYRTYQMLLGDLKEEHKHDPYLKGSVEISEICAWGDENYPGLTRELSRSVLPVAGYTEWYWKSNLHNIFRFLSLRQDKHAQYEIRAYADAMLKLIEPYFPIACEAYEDYILNGVELSRMEVDILKDILRHHSFSLDLDTVGKTHNLSKREINEFREKFNL